MVRVHSGDVIADRYRLEDMIGEGGMGVVWRATDLELRRQVAIKRATNGDTRREARIGAGLQHPNVIAVFDVLPWDGDTRLLVMEYLPSRSLTRVLREDGPLATDVAARVGAQITEALNAMHAKEMFHRDIAPGNILLAADGTAKLTDLGVAMWANVTTTGGSHGPGTPGYLAPEVVAGGVADAASDMYALGVTLATATEGAEDDDRSSWFGLVLAALTHTNPRRRPSAQQARQMLDEVATGAKTKRPLVSRRVVTALGGLLLVVATVAGVLVWQRLYPSYIGDPRTVDLCALMSKEPLRRFGSTRFEYDFGEYNRCDIVVDSDPTKPEKNVQVFMKFKTGAADDEGTWEESLKDGPIRVIALPDESDVCTRVILLPERHRLEVRAHNADKIAGDICGMVDAQTMHVLSKLHEGKLPRKAAPDPQSIAAVDACGLLALADLDRVLGRGAMSPEGAGIGNWSCSWAGSRTVTGVRIEVLRDHPIEPTDRYDYGRVIDIGDRRAAVDDSGDPWGKDTCVVRVIHRNYASNGLEGKKNEPKTEQFRLFVEGKDRPTGMGQLCQYAEQLAAQAVPKLPK